MTRPLFVELHHPFAEEISPYYLNVAHIRTISRDPNRKTTDIWLGHKGDRVVSRETPEEIFALIRRAQVPA